VVGGVTAKERRGTIGERANVGGAIREKTGKKIEQGGKKLNGGRGGID